MEINKLKNLLEELKFMKNIKTLESFKELIQKCDFWADTWAISTLERLLNIKLIIFSFHCKSFSNISGIRQVQF